MTDKLLPFLLALLVAFILGVLVPTLEAHGEMVRGVTKDGKAFVCEMKPPKPLLQFCVFFTKERE